MTREEGAAESAAPPPRFHLSQTCQPLGLQRSAPCHAPIVSTGFWPFPRCIRRKYGGKPAEVWPPGWPGGAGRSPQNRTAFGAAPSGQFPSSSTFPWKLRCGAFGPAPLRCHVCLCSKPETAVLPVRKPAPGRRPRSRRQVLNGPGPGGNFPGSAPPTAVEFPGPTPRACHIFPTPKFHTGCTCGAEYPLDLSQSRCHSSTCDVCRLYTEKRRLNELRLRRLAAR